MFDPFGKQEFSDQYPGQVRTQKCDVVESFVLTGSRHHQFSKHCRIHAPCSDDLQILLVLREV